MNPTLKKLSNPNLSRFEVAGLLEMHIGDGSNEIHCEEACKVLERIHDKKIRDVARVLVLLIDSEGQKCRTIRSVIDQLRSDAWE